MYHVIPVKNTWATKRHGKKRASKRFSKKENAIAWATIRCLKYKKALVVHARSGRVEYLKEYPKLLKEQEKIS